VGSNKTRAHRILAGPGDQGMQTGGIIGEVPRAAVWIKMNLDRVWGEAACG
jgi:hypothetical protein